MHINPKLIPTIVIVLSVLASVNYAVNKGLAAGDLLVGMRGPVPCGDVLSGAFLGEIECRCVSKGRA